MSIFTRAPPSLLIVIALCNGAIDARNVSGFSFAIRHTHEPALTVPQLRMPAPL